MKKSKYHFNFETGQFDPINTNRNSLFIVSIVLVFVIIFSFYAFNGKNNQVTDTKQSNAAEKELIEQYKVLNEKLEKTQKKLAELEKKDDKLYRSYFNLEPIDKEIRAAGHGGVNRYENISKGKYANLILETNKKLDKLNKQLAIESQSLDEIISLAKKRDKMFANLPAIQPIANKDLTNLASGFGMRLHPILKIERFHSGIDFTANTGTPIYATANGNVTYARYSGGYGNVVKIDHGFGYETLYAHLSKIKTTERKKVKRGEIIGFVGTTGLSTGAHLHYEISKNGEKIDPISYFIEDVTAQEIKILAKNASIKNQSFD